MNDTQRFIIKPNFKNLSEYRLNYKDILTYITIRSFYNSKDKYCYPSYATIAKRSGLSKKFISESVKRLECAGYLDIWKVGKFHVRHCYRFNDEGIYQKIPFSLLDANDISAFEKSMLLILVEYCDSLQRCFQSVSELAVSTGLTYRTIDCQLKSLILKGYVVQEMYENPLDKTFSKYFKLTDKLKWNFPGNFSFTSFKANDSKSESEGLAIVDMALKMVKAMKLSK